MEDALGVRHISGCATRPSRFEVNQVPDVAQDGHPVKEVMGGAAGGVIRAITGLHRGDDQGLCVASEQYRKTVVRVSLLSANAHRRDGVIGAVITIELLDKWRFGVRVLQRFLRHGIRHYGVPIFLDRGIFRDVKGNVNPFFTIFARLGNRLVMSLGVKDVRVAYTRDRDVSNLTLEGHGVLGHGVDISNTGRRVEAAKAFVNASITSAKGVATGVGPFANVDCNQETFANLVPTVM